MIQVYKKNELFTIENTVTDVIYPNLTREEALVLLKKFDRNDTEHRCDFAIKEDNMCFEYVSLDDKDKTIADLEAKLVEKDEQIKRRIAVYEKQFIEQTNENYELEQQLAEKENTITNLIEDSNASKELLKKQLNEQAGLCEEFRFQLAEKDKEIEYLNKQARKFNNEAQKYFEDAYCNDTIYQDKISFAVEQLEKVKEFLYSGYAVDNEEIEKEINNQIKELKEMK